MKILSFEEYIKESVSSDGNTNILDDTCKLFSDKIKKVSGISGNDETLVKYSVPDGVPEFPENSYLFEFDFDSLGYDDSTVYFDMLPEKPLKSYSYDEFVSEFTKKLDKFLNEKFDEEEFNLNDMSDKNIEYLKNILRKVVNTLKKV